MSFIDFKVDIVASYLKTRYIRAYNVICKATVVQIREIEILLYIYSLRELKSC